MKLCWVTLLVKDLEKSLSFYHGILGLPIDSQIKGDGMEMAMLGEKDQPKIELISFAHEKDKLYSSDISVGLEVESLEKAIKLLQEKQIVIASGPVSPLPHISFLFIHDPDGYTVQLVEIKKADKMV